MRNVDLIYYVDILTNKSFVQFVEIMSLYVEKYRFLQSFRLVCPKLLFFIFSDILYKKDRKNFITKLINRPEY